MQGIATECDVLIAGSGATGLLAAVRAHDAGLDVIVIEKSDRYGGTAAVSGGGIWVPMNHACPHDSEALALTYLQGCVGDASRTERLKQFIADAPRMARYLHEKAGVTLAALTDFPDYFSRLPGAIRGRALVPLDFDGKLLGEDFFKLRDCYSFLKLFGRLALNTFEAGIIGRKAPGWTKLLARRLAAYWLDLGWRRRTARDRRLSNGLALVGRLRHTLQLRGIPLHLNTGLVELLRDGERVTGAVIERNGQRQRISARRGVLIATGGFEANPSMREAHIPLASDPRASAAPNAINQGDGIRAGQAVGAAIDGMGFLWKAPAMRLVAGGESNAGFMQPLFWDRNAPGSICVNRNAQRFVNEAVSYDQFGAAMLADHTATGANLPCWMIFDAACRKRAMVGPLMPGELMPDSRVPPEWWDAVVFRADGIDALAAKIDLDAVALKRTVEAFNADARTGIDRQFDRGGCDYDRYWSDPTITPNGSLAPLATGPFYAVRLELGDIGTKGGLVTDAKSRVLDAYGTVIPGLFAAGNTAASIFGDAYPGAGGTLAPALTAAFVAAETLAESI